MRASAPTYDSSRATASGACSAISSPTPSKIVRSRSSGALARRVRHHPWHDRPEAPVAFVDDPVAARSRPWIDAEDLHVERLGTASDVPAGRRKGEGGRCVRPRLRERDDVRRLRALSPC